MNGFIPPPGYTTVRFDPRLRSAEDAKTSLESFLREDLEFRKIPQRHHDASQSMVEYHPSIPDVLLVEVKKLENVKPSEKKIFVDQWCGTAVMRGAHVFAPGIIAAPKGLKRGDSVSVFIDLQRKCLKGSFTFEGEEYFLGNGVAEVSRDDVFASNNREVSGVGIRMNEPIYLTPCLDLSSLPGIFFPQNFPSIVVGHVMNPPPHSIILDMCASPGGKSTHLCSFMHDTGHVIALDRTELKIKKITRNAKRLGCSGTLTAYCADSRCIASDSAPKLDERTGSDFAPPYPPESFSYILLDAPCSALGQRPRFPGVDLATKSAISSYPALQWQLFKRAVDLLACDGTLVYSTCTTTFDENERMVERVLRGYNNIELVNQTPHIGNIGRKGVSGLSEEMLSKLQYFDMLPTERETVHPADKDTIGFFIAKFRKRSSVDSRAA